MTIWDQRVSKTFQISDRHSIEATFDLFNSTNANNITRIRERVGSRFLEPGNILAPRIMRLGARWRF